ncbi:hypothetical protein [Chryseobacterium sp. Marseille-Q3244]|uniref:hypothetical protein n=1 Tax=Chryseobacterium sp. Marseille-Q3244 TaxID=2758092 RepID=UPI002024C092|nr:hypothetical protein [Chryseobacterium sp. Marseille-Q3244]
MSKKKLLIHELFRKAREESGKDTKNGLASYLWVYFKEDIGFEINDKTFGRYYDTYIKEKDEEKDIHIDRLDKISQYVGYKDFLDFSRTFTKKEEETNKTTVKIKVDEDEESLSEKLSNIIINITNEQHFKMPEFVKQNGLGIAGAFLIISVLIGNNYNSKSKSNSPLSFFGTSADERSCMFWDDSEYKLGDCEDKNPQRSLIPKDTVQLKYFKRITRKDTLTVDNALGSTWYSKFNGNVEFFTMDGVDPDTGRELRASTAYIIGKYAGY